MNILSFLLATLDNVWVVYAWYLVSELRSA